MRAFVKKELKYPTDALKNKVEGVVHLRYSINRHGKVFNIKIVKGIGHGCNKEAKRIIGLFTFEMPKNRAGRLIFHKTLQVHFRLPKASEMEKKIELVPQKPASQTEISYSYQTEDKNKSNTYSYSIQL